MVLKIKDWLKARHIMDRLDLYLSSCIDVPDSFKSYLRKSFLKGTRDGKSNLDNMLKAVNDSIDRLSKRR